MNALSKIAAVMRSVAETTGHASHTLERGLILTLRRRPAGGWVLSLARLGSPPGPLEETICREAFGVPDTAKRREVVRPNKFERDYHIVGFVWGPAARQLSLIGPAEETPNPYRFDPSTGSGRR